MLPAFHSILTKTDVEFRERTSRDYRDRTSLFKDKTLVVTGKRRILSREYVQCVSELATLRINHIFALL